MSTTIHFINVGQGNMALVQCADGTNFVVDCNITEDNESRVLTYLAAEIGRGSRLRAFICTHRDADHMRGVQVLHKHFPVQQVWDSGYPGTSTDTPEYEAYMRPPKSGGRKSDRKAKARRLWKNPLPVSECTGQQAAEERQRTRHRAEGGTEDT